jgi:hypothetical protein
LRADVYFSRNIRIYQIKLGGASSCDEVKNFTTYLNYHPNNLKAYQELGQEVGFALVFYRSSINSVKNSSLGAGFYVIRRENTISTDRDFCDKATHNNVVTHH